MLSVRELARLRVCKDLPEKRRVDKDGVPRSLPRLGKIHHAVFSPEGTRVVGFMVRQPDIAGMIKQPDVFVALDALRYRDGALVVSLDKDACDKRAINRLGIDFDRCLLWVGMDVRTEGGKKLGYCSDAVIDFKTGAVDHFEVTDGAASEALLGTVDLPTAYVRGYRSGCMVVDEASAQLKPTGGAAAKAAEASVVVGAKAKEAGEKIGAQASKAAKKLDDSASTAVDKGSRALGRQLKKTHGMFSAFKSEYQKAAGTSKKKKS